jgi:hypothetical protein
MTRAYFFPSHDVFARQPYYNSPVTSTATLECVYFTDEAMTAVADVAYTADGDALAGGVAVVNSESQVAGLYAAVDTLYELAPGKTEPYAIFAATDASEVAAALAAEVNARVAGDSGATAALGAHVAAPDPHGDRADAAGRYVPLTQRDAPSGYAGLDGSGHVPDALIPSTVTRDSELANALAALVNASPTTLDTLGEIAAAMGNDPNLAATLTASIGTKLATTTAAATYEAGTTAVLHVSATGSDAASGANFSTAKATIAAAYAALPATGGVIEVGAGTFSTATTPTTSTASKHVTIRGRGIGVTTLTRSAAVQVLNLNGAGANVVLEHLTVDGAALAASCVRISGLNRFEASRVRFKGAGVPGFAAGHFSGFDGLFASAGDGQTDTVVLRDCTFEDCERDGLFAFGGIKHFYESGTRYAGCGRFGSALSQNSANTFGPQTVRRRAVVASGCGAGGFSTETHASLTICELDDDVVVLDCGNNDWTYGWGYAAGVNTQGKVRATGRRCGKTNVGAYPIVGVLLIDSGGPVTVDADVSESQSHGVFVNRSGALAPFTHTVNVRSRANTACGVYAYNTAAPVVTGSAVLNGQHGVYAELCTGAVIGPMELRDNSQSAANTYAAVKTKDGDGPVLTGLHIVGTSHKYAWENVNCAYPTWEGNSPQSWGTAWFSDAGGTDATGTVNRGRRAFSGLAKAPTTGTWSVGDTMTAPGGERFTCTVAGTPGTWVSSMPGHVEVHAGATPDANTNWPGIVGLSATAYLNMSMDTQGGPTVNDTISYDLPIGAGTWTLDLLHLAGTNRGIYTVAVDGVTVGTVDGYNAVLSAVRGQVTGIAVATGGTHRVTLTVATKNATSTSYRGSVSAIMLTRTAP